MEKIEDIRSSEKTVEESVPSTPNQSEKHVSTELSIAVGDEHINLGWRSWLVVFMTCFAYVPIGGVLNYETQLIDCFQCHGTSVCGGRSWKCHIIHHSRNW